MQAFLSCRGWGEDEWDVTDVDVQMSNQVMWAWMGSWISLETPPCVCSTWLFNCSTVGCDMDTYNSGSIIKPVICRSTFVRMLHDNRLSS